MEYESKPIEEQENSLVAKRGSKPTQPISESFLATEQHPKSSIQWDPDDDFTGMGITGIRPPQVNRPES